MLTTTRSLVVTEVREPNRYADSAPAPAPAMPDISTPAASPP